MSVTRGTLAEALDMIDLQLLNGADEVVLPRDDAELVACALHEDSELIAAAVNALPGLLDALEKAERHRDSLAATLIEVQREKLAVEAARDRYGHAHKACHEQRDAAWAAIERVRELHYEATHETTWDTARYCEGCSEDWPCPTLQALDGGEVDD